MVRGALFKKSLRDMQKAKVQFISIFVMAALAVSIITGLDSVWYTVRRTTDAMYAASNLSDLWVTVSNPSEQDLWGIRRLTGVTRVEKRFSAEADTALPGKPTLHVYALDDRSTLDQPEMREGRFGRYGGGAVLDSSFAEAHGLKVGDSISFKLNGVWMRMPIDGLALDSEQVYAVKNAATITPNSKEYGFAVIHAGALESVYGRSVYNQISVKAAPDTDLDQVVREADAVIGKRLIGITLQKDSASVSSVNGRIQQFKSLSVVFPLLFFIVSALITQSTMVRIVESQRGQIGILKALGYSKRSIIWHYTSYGVITGVLGSVAGLIIGPNLFGRVLVPQLRLSLSSYSIHVNYPNFLLAFLLILLCTGGVSFYACRKLLADTPAVLLRDKPMKEGTHVFAESTTLWQRMTFSNKLMVRNTMKNKGRFIMGVIGVMGCVGVIIAALTLRSTIAGLNEQMYGSTFTYDQKVLVDPQKTDSHYLGNLGLDAVTQQVQESAVEVICPSGGQKMEPITITTKDSPLIHMQSVDGTPVSLPDTGIAMSRKLCDTLGVKQGNSIWIKRTNKGYISVPIEEVSYMASGQGIYVTDGYWRSLGETFSPTALLIRWNGPPDERFLKSDMIMDSATRESQNSGLSESMQVVNFAVAAMIIMGASLAFVVLYNISILNFTERIRDLATLRVLGFHHREIRNLVLLENYFSAFLGTLAGIPIGKFISWLIASSLDERLDLTGSITLPAVLTAAVMTLGFAWAINTMVARKMKRIDMLEALKSVE